jgi:hypothetical protein
LFASGGPNDRINRCGSQVDRAGRLKPEQPRPRLFPEMLHKRDDARLAHRRIPAVTARGSERADALPVDKDRVAADENCEAAFMLG